MTEDACPICRKDECDHTEEEQAEAARRLAAGDEELTLAHDGGQQKRRKSKADRAEEVFLDDLRWLMSSQRGRRLVWDLIAVRCNTFGSAWMRGAADDGMARALGLSFGEGERNVGLSYLDPLMRHCAEDYAAMIAEHGGK